MGSTTKSEYFPDHPTGTVVEGVLNQDIQKLTFPDSAFDLVTSNQVFEHVPDDMAGYREIYRVLRPGGAMIFSVPLYDTPATLRLPNSRMAKSYSSANLSITTRDWAVQNQPQYFGRHSLRDICNRVMQAGFRNAELKEVTLAPSQNILPWSSMPSNDLRPPCPLQTLQVYRDLFWVSISRSPDAMIGGLDGFLAMRLMSFKAGIWLPNSDRDCGGSK